MYAAPSTGAPRTPTQHDGQPTDPDDDVPVQPDPSIGGIVSVQTNRTRSGWKKMTSTEKSPRIALGVIAFIVGGLLGAAAGAGIAREIAMRGYPQVMLYETLIAVALGIAGAILPTLIVVVLSLVTRKRRASFVGTDGVMEWSAGLFGPSPRVLRFSDAHELRVQRIRQFVNGAYTGTFYTYTWTGPSGAQVFRLNGSYRDTDPIVGHDPVAFAFAAERAWTKHKIELVDRAMRAEGVARFRSGAGTIGVGRGFLELAVGGRTERIDRADIESVQTHAGTLVVRRRGAKEGFFSSEGVFKFPIAQMADFTVFAITLEEQLQLKLA